MGLFSSAMGGLAGLGGKATGALGGAAGGLLGGAAGAASRFASPTAAPSAPNTSGGMQFGTGPWGRLASNVYNQASQRDLVGAPPTVGAPWMKS